MILADNAPLNTNILHEYKPREKSHLPVSLV